MGALDKITHTEKKLGEFLKLFKSELANLKKEIQNWKEILGNGENPIVERAKNRLKALWKIDKEGRYNTEKISLKARKEMAINNPAYDKFQEGSEKYSMETINGDDISSETVYSYSEKENKVYANIDYNYGVGVVVPEMGITKRVVSYDLGSSSFSSQSYFKSWESTIVINKATNDRGEFDERISKINTKLLSLTDTGKVYINIWKRLKDVEPITDIWWEKRIKNMSNTKYIYIANETAEWINSTSTAATLHYYNNENMQIYRETSDVSWKISTITEIINLEDLNNPKLQITTFTTGQDSKQSFEITDKVIILKKLQEIMDNL